MPATQNRVIATGLWRWCRDAGVQNIVVCAGARNVPLVVPILELDEANCGFATLWNHFDERAAAFFALGLAKAAGTPTVVVTTSGTAVAECFPAVVEAHYAGIPLIIVSADRPKHFRGSGAPQAIEQRQMFGPMVEAAFDIDDLTGIGRLRALRWTGAAPLQVNICFDEPLLGATDPSDDWLDTPGELAGMNRSRGILRGFEDYLFQLAEPGDGLVIVGEITDREERVIVREFLLKLGVPVFAEATSGLRECSNLASIRLDGGERGLKELNPRAVLRLGGVPSARYWRDLEAHTNVEVFSVTRTGFSGLGRPSRTWEATLSILSDVRVPADLPSQPGLDIEIGSLHTAFPGSEPSQIHRLSEQIPSESLIYLGNSLPIREWNLAASLAIPHPNIYASRGANGIDGQLSTFFGLAAVSGSESWGIFGDLTSLYDLNGPWILSQLATDRPIRIVVVNNGGGQIFSRLPALKSLSEQDHGVIQNRHHLCFERWADLWELNYIRVEGSERVPAEFLREHDRAVIELVPDATHTDEFFTAYPQLER